MDGGSSRTRWRAGVATSPNSLTPQSGNAINIPRSHNTSDGEAEIAAHPGIPIAGGSSDQRSRIRFNTSATSHQRTVPDHNLDDPENFDDGPYVPPRVAQAELQTYPALDPRVGNVYDPPNHDIQHVRVYFGIRLGTNSLSCPFAAISIRGRYESRRVTEQCRKQLEYFLFLLCPQSTTSP